MRFSKTVDFKKINAYIAKNQSVRRACLNAVNKKVQLAKNQLILEFSSHPVSNEIQSGPNTSNSSGTLNGYGNLFSFIGFAAGQNPVDQWVNFLKRHIVLKETQRSDAKTDSFTVSFEIPNISNIELVNYASMPWEPGRSWIMGIEKGISGFSNYISKSMGRSGGGIQSKYNVRGGQFSRRSYWTKMWNNFTKDISK